MASELLVIPEVHLEEVIAVIMAGLASESCKSVSSDAKRNLLKWCKDQAEYLNRK